MEHYLDIIFRCLIVYVFMLVAIRLGGKKELSQLNTTDIVLILLISNSVQNAMVGPDNSLLGGLIAAAVLFILNFILKKILFKNEKFRNLLNTKPEILVHDGRMDFAVLTKLGITHEELLQAVREHGVAGVNEVKLAMMEVDGNISVITGNENLKQTHYKRHRKQHAQSLMQ